MGQYLGWRYTFYMVTLIGVLSALAVIATVHGRQAQPSAQSRIRDELKVLRHPAVLRSLLITALGFSGVFAAFTYIAPMLKTVTGVSEHLIPPVLMLFGVGMVAGNHLGGRLTDGGVRRALLLTLALLSVVLCLFPWAIQTLPGACAAVFLLGRRCSPPFRRCRCRRWTAVRAVKAWSPRAISPPLTSAMPAAHGLAGCCSPPASLYLTFLWPVLA